MDTLTYDSIKELIDNNVPPCLSLYQTTHRSHPDRLQDPVLFKNLVKSLETSLYQNYEAALVTKLLHPFYDLAENHIFWNNTTDALAILCSPDIFRIYKLQRPVGELAVVASNFHIKPLIRILQSTDRYHVLGINRNQVKLFEGNRDSLHEIDLHPEVPKTMTEALGEDISSPRLTVATYGSNGGGLAMHHGHGGRKDEVDQDTLRFFQRVDRAILQHHSQPTGLPLLLAALPEHHHKFRSVSHNPFLMDVGLDVHPDSISADALREEAWQHIKPRYLKRLHDLIDKYQLAQSKNTGSDQLGEIGKALVSGRVATLLIEADRQIAGRINTETGDIEYSDLKNPQVDDVLDEFAELTIKTGGEAIVVPGENMPTNTGAVAIYRY